MIKQIFFLLDSGSDKKVKIVFSLQIHEPTVRNGTKNRIKKSKNVQ